MTDGGSNHIVWAPYCHKNHIESVDKNRMLSAVSFRKKLC